jgi:hypothetical protein
MCWLLHSHVECMCTHHGTHSCTPGYRVLEYPTVPRETTHSKFLDFLARCQSTVYLYYKITKISVLDKFLIYRIEPTAVIKSKIFCDE